jgi:hypothetical protein
LLLVVLQLEKVPNNSFKQVPMESDAVSEMVPFVLQELSLDLVSLNFLH